jgi:import inner membrane translocase subunit TIM50
MSLASQMLRASLRSSAALRSTPSQTASTSQLFLRAYARPAGPSDQKPFNNRNTNEESALTNEPLDPSASRIPPFGSTFDINPAASDLVALRGSGTTNARKQGASQEEKAKRKRTTYRWLAGLLSGALTYIVVRDLGREWDTIDEYDKYANDPATNTTISRARLRILNMYKGLKEPIWEKLLPDPLPFPYNRPYTLVVDLDDLLVHHEWTRATAWKTSKRPGLNYFLGYLSPWYEIVLYTTQPFHVVAPVIEQLDPDRRYFSYQLFRESCRTLDSGQIVKDLSALNRDLSKVVILETDPDVVQLHPENSIIMKKWDGKGSDRELIGVCDFLEAIGIYNIQDVRPTIKAYEGTYLPTEHAKRQLETKRLQEEDWKKKHENKKGSWFGGFSSAVSKTDIPKSFYELEKERFQKAYMEDEQYWKENGPILKKQMEEEQQKMIKESKISPLAFLSGIGPQPKEPEIVEKQ